NSHICSLYTSSRTVSAPPRYPARTLLSDPQPLFTIPSAPPLTDKPSSPAHQHHQCPPSRRYQSLSITSDRQALVPSHSASPVTDRAALTDRFDLIILIYLFFRLIE